MKGPKPQHLRIEPDGLADRPAPDWLSPDAKAEWERLVPILAGRRVLTEADVGILENFCIALGTVREMEREIQRSGALQKIYQLDKEGVSRLLRISKNPAVSIRSDAMTQARLMAAELGATPVSRARPAVEDAEDGDLFSLFG